MKVTKFTHSCLYVETPDRVVLFDPGEFSWESKGFSLDKISRLDRIAITHAHGDHLHLPFIKALAEKFPQAQVVANAAIQAALHSEGIKLTMRDSTACTVSFAAEHDSRIPWAPGLPQHSGFHFQKLLTHPGDSIAITETKQVLAWPMTAPWAGMGESMLAVEQLHPVAVIPIHDWHWNDQARSDAYELAASYLGERDIQFIPLNDGDSHTFNDLQSVD